MKKKTQLRLYNAQIMMLDEPTNHMDVKKVQELVDYLNGLKEVTCLIVSHDTNFLDNVCTDILHYETRKLVSYKGNLSAFVAQKPEVLLRAQVIAGPRLELPGPRFPRGDQDNNQGHREVHEHHFRTFSWAGWHSPRNLCAFKFHLPALLSVLSDCSERLTCALFSCCSVHRPILELRRTSSSASPSSARLRAAWRASGQMAPERVPW